MNHCFPVTAAVTEDNIQQNVCTFGPYDVLHNIQNNLTKLALTEIPMITSMIELELPHIIILASQLTVDIVQFNCCQLSWDSRYQQSFGGETGNYWGLGQNNIITFMDAIRAAYSLTRIFTGGITHVQTVQQAVNTLIHSPHPPKLQTLFWWHVLYIPCHEMKFHCDSAQQSLVKLRIYYT